MGWAGPPPPREDGSGSTPGAAEHLPGLQRKQPWARPASWSGDQAQRQPGLAHPRIRASGQRVSSAPASVSPGKDPPGPPERGGGRGQGRSSFFRSSQHLRKKNQVVSQEQQLRKCLRIASCIRECGQTSPTHLSSGEDAVWVPGQELSGARGVSLLPGMCALWGQG